jgi:glycerophosphoryl diester phosphodiesterase
MVVASTVDVTIIIPCHLISNKFDSPMSDMQSIDDVIARTGGFPVLGVHRGGMVENTMYGFEDAVKHGARILELDLRMTKDDELILMHDSTVDRTTDGQGAINQYTLDEILQLDAAYAHVDLRGRGIRVATFKEFLDRFIPMKDLMFIFDFKDCQCIRAVMSVLQHYDDIHHRYILHGVFEECNQLLRQIRPLEATPVITDITQTFKITTAFRMGIWRMCTIEHEIFGFILLPPTLRFFTKQLVDALHGRGVKVLICGAEVNKEENLKKWIDFGVDYILIDDIVLMSKFVQSLSHQD